MIFQEHQNFVFHMFENLSNFKQFLRIWEKYLTFLRDF